MPTRSALAAQKKIGELRLRFILRGQSSVKISYDAEKGGYAETSVRLESHVTADGLH